VSGVDLKPENILVTTGRTLKLADFGLAKNHAVFASSIVGTLLYKAPELLTKRPRYNNSVDLWAAGVILFEMVFGEVPFSEQDIQAKRYEIRNVITARHITGMHSFCRCVQQLLDRNPRDRLTAEDVLVHPFVVCKGVDASDHDEDDDDGDDFEDGRGDDDVGVQQLDDVERDDDNDDFGDGRVNDEVATQVEDQSPASRRGKHWLTPKHDSPLAVIGNDDDNNMLEQPASTKRRRLDDSSGSHPKEENAHSDSLEQSEQADSKPRVSEHSTPEIFNAAVESSPEFDNSDMEGVASTLHSVVLREISCWQRSTTLLMSKWQFASLVVSILQDNGLGLTMQQAALTNLQEGTEAYLVDLFRWSNKCAHHRGSDKICRADMQLAIDMRSP
jgi:serine/threonine protein kinase